MDNKKFLLIIGVIVLIIFIIFIVKNNNKTSINNDGYSETGNIEQVEDGKFVVTSSSGEQVYTNTIEEAQWYQEHPDYNPEPVHFEGDEASIEEN